MFFLFLIVFWQAIIEGVKTVCTLNEGTLYKPFSIPTTEQICLEQNKDLGERLCYLCGVGRTSFGVFSL